VVLCYANRDERSVIFAAELRELAARYAGRLTVLHWLESVQGLPTRAQLTGFARTVFSGSATFESFICGPAAFMSVVKEALSEAGLPRERIHLEVFQSLSSDPFANEMSSQQIIPMVETLQRYGSTLTARATNCDGRGAQHWSTR